ncbi:small proline-rich protein 2F-like isoform X2 [Eleutherodactylus coqui]|uniref:small proline-rich protein 2F-like isoform X2 n=1 Tax=Eleutherodactylus coqui TaxID=57060 RepID=UPI003463563E
MSGVKGQQKKCREPSPPPQKCQAPCEPEPIQCKAPPPQACDPEPVQCQAPPKCPSPQACVPEPVCEPKVPPQVISHQKKDNVGVKK